MAKAKKPKKFDPNSKASLDSGIFGLETLEKDSKLVILPVPFEATTSYRTGTKLAPSKILEASKQVDLYHDLFPAAYESGILQREESKKILDWNKQARSLVEAYRKKPNDSQLQKINSISSSLNEFVYTESRKILENDKLLGLIGGDHSVPFGAIQACLEKHPQMGILHIDAHFDLRNAYEGFTDSHASIMFNVATKLPITKLVQVGLRDFCQDEIEFSRSRKTLKAFTDKDLFEQKAEGSSWGKICNQIINELPEEVYISFDIDGLDPQYCPETGTPVPGGLSFNEATYLFRQIVKANKKIVGFDLVEVGASEYDAVVGARMLFELSCLTIGTNTSQKLRQIK